jgi:sarcosine oxidase delta subunit
MDLWGHCTTCERWFSMAGGTRTCPVCQSEPLVVTDRDEDQAAAGMA